MSRAKVHIVVHDNHGGWEGRPMPGIDNDTPPFFAYVLGNPRVGFGGKTEGEVVEKVRKALLLDSDKRTTRKIVELDLGDHVLAEDIMSG